MKKLIALLLSAVMLLSLCACNGGKEEPTNPPAGTKPTAPKPNKETTAPVQEEGERMETSRWSLRYDPEVWVWEEEDLADDDYDSSIILQIPDPEDEGNYLVWLYVAAFPTDHSNFRDSLRYYDFDAYEYAVNNAYEAIRVGGLDLLAWEDGTDAFYFTRLVGAGTDVEISISGDLSHAALKDVLDSLVFTIEDTGNTDAPWPWEGEPYRVASGELAVGSYVLRSQQLPFQDCITTFETFDHNIAATEDSVFMINDGAVSRYTLSADTLFLAETLDLGEEYEIVDASSGGTVWFSTFMANLLRLDRNGAMAYSGTDYVSMHPSGKWGISWFSDSDILKISFSDGAASSEAFTLAEVDSIAHLCVDAYGNVFVCGSSATDDNGHRVFVYDENLQLKTILLDEEGDTLGSVTFAVQTENGYLILDGNMRQVLLYDEDGTFNGMCRFSELFGTNYPWACDACMAPDGSILVLMTDERPDESADEVIVLRLTGF